MDALTGVHTFFVCICHPYLLSNGLLKQYAGKLNIGSRVGVLFLWIVKRKNSR